MFFLSFLQTIFVSFSKPYKHLFSSVWTHFSLGLYGYGEEYNSFLHHLPFKLDEKKERKI